MRATWEGHESLVAFLLARGADVKLQDRRGKTALDIAARFRGAVPSRYTRVLARLEAAPSH